MKVFSLIFKLPPYVYGIAYFGLVPLYALLYTFFPAAVLDYGEHNSGFITNFYFSGITLTTLGYGDIKPVGALSQMLTTSQALFGVLFIGLFLNSLSYQRKLNSRKREKEMVKNAVTKKVVSLIGSPYMFAMKKAANIKSDGALTDEIIAKVFENTNPNALPLPETFVVDET